ncbi:MAG: biotin--[acetyl-CoA-carboxylase] ligase [Nitrospinae bacterium]|nr:biotin--[acetyl-CoA-carboxylase] ligase [Nitrospinota bacterium]
MDENKISELLTTSEFGRNLLLIDETDSTNAEALRLIKKGPVKNGTTIIAEKQTAGKGRFGRAWLSDGGLCMTVIIKYAGNPPPLATLSAGVAVAEGLSTAVGREFFVKYPNDVYTAKTGGRKIGGILAQSAKGHLIIGIGVNVSQESFPAELLEKAESLKTLGMTISKEAVAGHILNSLERNMELADAGNIGLIRGKWLKLNCTIGERVSIRDVSPPVEGTAAGLDEDGALVVETANGPVRVRAGEITIEG